MSLALRHADRLAALPGIAALCQRIEALQGTRQPYALLLVDPDRFGLFNACFGDARGDEMLERIAAVLPCEVPRAFVARTGGARFSVLLPNTEPPAARAYAERVRRDACALLAPWDATPLRSTHARLTGRAAPPRRPLLGVSVALAHVAAGAGTRTADVLARLHDLMHAAKSAGGNQLAA